MVAREHIVNRHSDSNSICPVFHIRVALRLRFLSKRVGTTILYFRAILSCDASVVLVFHGGGVLYNKEHNFCHAGDDDYLHSNEV